MQILARIPVLQDADAPADRCAVTPPARNTSGAGLAAVSALDESVEESAVVALECADRPPVAHHGRGSRLPAPSILVLVILAVAMWGAALRNDRLRLDAARRARAERLAQVVPDAVIPQASRTR